MVHVHVHVCVKFATHYIYMYILFFNHSVLQFVMMLYNVVSEKDLKLRQVSAWMSCVNVYIHGKYIAH